MKLSCPWRLREPGRGEGSMPPNPGPTHVGIPETGCASVQTVCRHVRYQSSRGEPWRRSSIQARAGPFGGRFHPNLDVVPLRVRRRRSMRGMERRSRLRRPRFPVLGPEFPVPQLREISANLLETDRFSGEFGRSRAHDRRNSLYFPSFQGNLRRRVRSRLRTPPRSR